MADTEPVKQMATRLFDALQRGVPEPAFTDKLQTFSGETAGPKRGKNMSFQEIIKLHPQPTNLDRDTLLRCIDECLECAASCTACADASVSEDDVRELVHVIRLCLDCADVCEATGRIVTRQAAPDLGLLHPMLEACSVACLASAEECERHAAHHEHCRICAEVCRRCKKACDDLLSALP
jgi:hypothetical protein